MGLFDERVDHRLGIFTFYSGEQHVATMTLNQGCDLTVVAAEYEVTFPVTRYGTILDLGRSFAD